MRLARLASTVTVLLLSAGCAPYPSPAGPSPAAEGAPGQAAPDEAANAEPAADQVAPLKKPKSKWSVNGRSLSDVGSGELAAAFMQAGLTDEVRGGAEHASGYDAIRFELDNGDVKGRFLLVRPAPRPTHKAAITTPSEAKAKMDPAGAAGVLDAEADVYFEITLTEGGKAAEAKQMLDKVIQSGR